MNPSAIEWTDATWNPVRGCSRVSEGCRNCYAERIAARFISTKHGNPGPFHGFVIRTDAGPRWTGRVSPIESKLLEPTHWREPKRIFVNSMSDLFHESLPDGAIDTVFAVMSQCKQHTFQILTKRARRMRDWFRRADIVDSIDLGAEELAWCHANIQTWPLPNVQLGVSAENQTAADERIPYLLETPAAVRFLSAEPLLGPIDLAPIDYSFLDWVIAGGESGPHARPPHPDWFRTLRDNCQRAGVPFFFKQWGEFRPASYDEMQSSFVGVAVERDKDQCGYYCDERVGHVDHGQVWMSRVGKSAAGRELDGREYNEFPQAKVNV